MVSHFLMLSGGICWLCPLLTRVYCHVQGLCCGVFDDSVAGAIASAYVGKGILYRCGYVLIIICILFQNKLYSIFLTPAIMYVGEGILYRCRYVLKNILPSFKKMYRNSFSAGISQRFKTPSCFFFSADLHRSSFFAFSNVIFAETPLRILQTGHGSRLFKEK